MRIIAGRLKGRRLAAPPGEATRPTADRVRQALFDAMTHAPWAGRERLEEAVVLDAFAGTGSLGLEALSRGAAEVTFLENARPAVAVVRANIAVCKAEAATQVIVGDATRPPRAKKPCSLVFLDPPYGRDLIATAVTALAAMGWFAPGALLVAEAGRNEAAPELAGFTLCDERAHGAAVLRVWQGA